MEFKNKRVAGFVTTVIGAVLGKIFILDVLQAAKEHQTEITIYRSGIVASILCILLGLLYILFGDKVEGLLKFDPDNLKFKNIIVILILASIGLATYVWVNIELSRLGFK